MKYIQVKVKPNAGASELIAPENDGVWTARLKSPPVDGKANSELIALVARHFACHKRDVSIKRGGSSRVKLVQVGRD
jgi:hypothetical protein